MQVRLVIHSSVIRDLHSDVHLMTAIASELTADPHAREVAIRGIKFDRYITMFNGTPSRTLQGTGLFFRGYN